MSSTDAFLNSARETLARPDERIGRFVVLASLGSGGMGSVYRAWDPELRREVALKVMHADGPEDRARFRREATLLASLRHPNIVPVFEVGESRGRCYLAMSLIDGPSLQDASLDRARGVRLVAEAARAVQAAHAAGILHRDLKPANLLLDHEGRLYVADFGLARRLGDPAISTPGMVVGTPAFMAPEQARGDSAIGTSADVYSLGATLYALLTGSAPPKGCDSPFPNGTPPDLRAVTRRAMAVAPSDRYPSASALAEDLERWICGEPVVGERPWRRLRRRVRRNPAAWAMAGLLVTTLLAGGVLFGRQRTEMIRLESFWNSVKLPRQYARTQAQIDPLLRRADEAFYGGRVPSPAEADALLVQLEEELAKLDEPWHRTSLPDAYRGWFLVHLGRIEDGESKLRGAGRVDRGDPFGSVFLARWRLRKIGRILKPDSEERRREIETLREELEPLAEWKGWEEAPEAASHRNFVLGLRRVLAKENAEDSLRALRRDPAYARDVEEMERLGK